MAALADKLFFAAFWPFLLFLLVFFDNICSPSTFVINITHILGKNLSNFIAKTLKNLDEIERIIRSYQDTAVIVGQEITCNLRTQNFYIVAPSISHLVS